jgi:uncharacterized membrane protein
MIAVTTIARGDGSRVTEPRRVLCSTPEEWRTLWALHAGPGAAAPAVDLTAVIVAAAFAGEKPSAGYAIEISAAEPADPAGGVRLAVEERQAGAGGVLAQVITSPFHIVAVAKAAGEITWADARHPSRDLRPASEPRPPSSTGLEPRTASALAYLAGPFSGALILLAESANPDVRFHAWQSIVGLGGLGLAVLASYLLAFVALFVSATAVSLMVGVATVIWIVLVIVWVVCLWKAWSGERWKLPLVGDYAERFV